MVIKRILKDYYEIVSAEGTISSDGIHVHIAISDAMDEFMEDTF